MRIIQFSQDCEATLTKVAKQFNIENDKLFEMYLQIMKSNFEQDLWDIANENEEELKGEL